MAGKNAEVVEINVDELALSLVGWQVEEVQARLVTEPDGSGHHKQQLAFSGSFRFLAEDWADRFKRNDGDSYASEVFLTLNRRDTPAPSSNFKWVVLEKIKKAKKGLVRVSAQSDPWTCRDPLAANDLDVRLTAYDLDDVTGVYINSKLELPSETTVPLAIIVVDETSVQAPRPKFAATQAYVSQWQRHTELTVHVEGIFEFAGAEALFETYIDRRDRGGRGWTIEDSAPFEVDVPEIKFEILDDTGFLLDDRTCTFYGHIPVDEHGNAPSRPPRWIGRHVIDVSSLPGDPHRVVVRVIDGDE